MTAAVGFAPKLSSGIRIIDETWGGLYQGGSYLVYGRAANDRDLIPMLFAAQTARTDSCLYLCSAAPGDVQARAGGLGIALEAGGSIELEQLPRLTTESNDEQLAAGLAEVVARLEAARPGRAVIDDFASFVRFRSFGRFRDAFIEMLQRIDATDATLMLVLAEPANEASESLITFMRSQMTGTLHIDRMPGEHPSTLRRLTFLPNIGHVGREGDLEWDVRRWLEPPAAAGRSERRFRFADESEAGPSPRLARWDEDPSEPIVPSIRLGGGTAAEESDAGRRSPCRISEERAGETRIPGIPLGRPEGATRHVPEPDVRQKAAAAEPDETQWVPQPSSVEPIALAESPPKPISHTDREAFRARLQQQFLRQDVDQTPFLLIAMRMDRPDGDTSRPFDFDVIVDLVSESLREQDDVLVDLERERLIVMLAESRPDASQPFFARLKQRLREETPHQADYLMRSVSAIVIPNGEPFTAAGEFLAYALDET